MQKINCNRNSGQLLKSLKPKQMQVKQTLPKPYKMQLSLLNSHKLR